ncbi:hypothetical protein RCL_jg23784.t2 [Rhizophagus clarus]|uniref:Uncharacterized protein n=1 Tax=Rhizophagus clarus TaxID=94130 RepID=A0A8H3LP54_9GLOM|nr:hypothetical protein RCL_jg23784.t2 [Rhizophagus clarus]
MKPVFYDKAIFRFFGVANFLGTALLHIRRTCILEIRRNACDMWCPIFIIPYEEYIYNVWCEIGCKYDKNVRDEKLFDVDCIYRKVHYLLCCYRYILILLVSVLKAPLCVIRMKFCKIYRNQANQFASLYFSFII